MRRMSSMLFEYLSCKVSSLRWAWFGIALCVMVPAASAPAQAPDVDQWSRLYAANNLDNEGNTPFHLKMTFQLYDLAGKPAETGTVEEWWVPQKFKRIISSPTLDGEGPSSSIHSPAAMRESYLVDQLINVAVHPVPKATLGSGNKTNEITRNFGKTALDCITPEPSLPPVPFSNLPTLCAEPKTDELRLLSLGSEIEMVARNSIGKFHDTYVARDLLISLAGRDAITGKLAVLQSFDPAGSAVDFPSSASGPATAPALSGSVNSQRIPAGVLAGKRINFVQPEYPREAKLKHMSGRVLLRAIITKEGTVHDLIPIAISDPIFTDAAMDAVRKWKYSPYLLNGEPTEVDTTITVNFALN